MRTSPERVTFGATMTSATSRSGPGFVSARSTPGGTTIASSAVSSSVCEPAVRRPCPSITMYSSSEALGERRVSS
jgi:hypothetical protein